MNYNKQEYTLDQVDEIVKQLDGIVDKPTLLMLIESADEAKEGSYSPYSKLRVGCALFTSNNKVIKGANVENASYGVTICAERSALCSAVNQGERQFKVAVVTTDMEFLVTPCAACRQFLSEFKVPHVVCFTSNKRLFYFPMEYLLPGSPDLDYLKQ